MVGHIEYILASDVINTQLLPHELNIGKCLSIISRKKTHIYSNLMRRDYSNCEILKTLEIERPEYL